MMRDRDRRERDADEGVTGANGTNGANGTADVDVPGSDDGAAADGTPAAAAAAGVETSHGDGPGGGGDDVAELERLQREVSALTDRHLRLAAEFDNYRKRVAREQAEQHTRSQADLARRLLDVLDDLQRVEQFDPATVTTESLLHALELVEKKFRTALESAGLEEIQAQGEPFNPEFMEALMTAPAEHPEEDEIVGDVFQKGYRMGSTLVRPARVRVKKYEG